eukprot:2525888-Amphidinium_carterae.1
MFCESGSYNPIQQCKHVVIATGKMPELVEALGNLDRSASWAITHLAFGREIDMNIQANERFARHFPAQRMSQRQTREILLSANPSTADVYAAEHLVILSFMLSRCCWPRA